MYTQRKQINRKTFHKNKIKTMKNQKVTRKIKLKTWTKDAKDGEQNVKSTN
jgi:hypothetical protein